MRDNYLKQVVDAEIKIWVDAVIKNTPDDEQLDYSTFYEVIHSPYYYLNESVVNHTEESRQYVYGWCKTQENTDWLKTRLKQG